MFFYAFQSGSKSLRVNWVHLFRSENFSFHAHANTIDFFVLFYLPLTNFWMAYFLANVLQKCFKWTYTFVFVAKFFPLRIPGNAPFFFAHQGINFIFYNSVSLTPTSWNESLSFWWNESILNAFAIWNALQECEGKPGPRVLNY